MERCSYFIPKKALFGSFPSQEAVSILESEGVKYFIDLTNKGERFIKKYVTIYNYINYPIKDHSVPDDKVSFSQLIIKLCDIICTLQNDDKIYIHCKGGHGRSGILVACILCKYYNLTPREALIETNRCHRNRLHMRERWRKIGSPQSINQKEFVYSFFKPFYFKKNIFNDNVLSIDLGTFKNTIQLLKSQNLTKQEQLDFMYKILQKKFNHCDELKENLLNTGLRPIIKTSIDTFWGSGINGKGENNYGKILVKIRDDFFLDV